MTTINRQNVMKSRKVLIKSNSGKVIRQTKIHDPAHSVKVG